MSVYNPGQLQVRHFLALLPSCLEWRSLSNSSPLAWFTVKPNKLKCWSLEQRNGYCRVKQGVNLRYDTTLIAESEELKSVLMKVKEESEKVCLKLNIHKTKIMTSGPIMANMGKQQKQCQTLFLGAPKSLQMVIAAMKLKDAYSLEEKLWPT